MIASPVHAALCAFLATAFFWLVGFACAQRLFPRALAIAAAPIIGWAVYNAATLPIYFVVGFSAFTVAIVALLFSIGSIAWIIVGRNNDPEPAIPAIPIWAYAAAIALALVPAAAIAPKISADAVQLADAIFDHSKIAIIDAMVRHGLPPVNPFFGEHGELGRLTYYYLYYFGAAQLAHVTGVTGWEADIAMTWFAAFSSLALMMGLATNLSGRRSAAIWAVILASATSIRDAFTLLFGQERVDSVLASATGFAGWLFQAAWVPQHLTAASCVVAAILVLSRCARRPTIISFVILALLVIAGFESSTYVGGVTLAIAALAIAPVLYFHIEPARRKRVLQGLGLAALLVACMVTPFILDQIGTIAQRDVRAPIYFEHFEVLRSSASSMLRSAFDWPVYWLVLLPVEFPAVYVAGAITLFMLLRIGDPRVDRTTVLICAILSISGFVISWLLVIDVGGNNDLRMRAVLPSALIFTAFAAAGVTYRPRRILIIAAAIGGLFLSLPNTFGMIRYNFTGDAVPEAKLFAQTPELWAAVRRVAAPDRRVGNNPLFMRSMTPWPVNISWAVLADRNSCFAAEDLVLAYVAMPRERRAAIYAQFIRVFEGNGTANDVSDLAVRYGCDVIVVTAQDKAWNADPFAESALYRACARHVKGGGEFTRSSHRALGQPSRLQI